MAVGRKLPINVGDAPLCGTSKRGHVDHEHKIAECLESWIGAFSYVLEDPERQIAGLRNPQLEPCTRFTHGVGSGGDLVCFFFVPEPPSAGSESPVNDFTGQFSNRAPGRTWYNRAICGTDVPRWDYFRFPDYSPRISFFSCQNAVSRQNGNKVFGDSVNRRPYGESNFACVIDGYVSHTTCSMSTPDSTYCLVEPGFRLLSVPPFHRETPSLLPQTPPSFQLAACVRTCRTSPTSLLRSPMRNVRRPQLEPACPASPTPLASAS